MKKILTSVDFETYNKNKEISALQTYKGSEIYSYCIGYVDNKNKIQVVVKDYKGKDKDYLHKYLLNPNYIKIAHNFKYELSLIKFNNIPYDANTLWHDTMIQSQLLFNTLHSQTLDSIAYDFFGIPRDLDIRFKKYMDKGITVPELPKDFLYRYQVADGIRPLLIHYLMFPKIYKNKKLYKCYCNEIENVKFTQQEEQKGIMLHQENMGLIKDKLVFALNGLKKYYKEDLNLSSPKQLRKLFYEDLKIKPTIFTAKGEPSTSKHVIMKLVKENPSPQLHGIIKHRSYSTALKNITKWEKFQDKCGVIHPDIATNVARTGRRSCSNPNLQNINKEKALLNLYAVPLRKCFQPRPNHVLLPVDYSSIELRLIINAAQEFEIIDLVQNNPNTDLHHFTIECFLMPKLFEFKDDLIYSTGCQEALLLKTNDRKTYDLHRSAYKNTGFCIGYGGGLEKVSEVLAKDIKEIYYGDQNFRKRFPKINTFSKDTIEEVKRTGGVTTSFGRFLRVDPSKAFAGANYKIQGTAAEILKRGQVQLLSVIDKSPALKKGVRIILDIHDENIPEMHKSLLPYKDEILPQFQEAMTYLPEIDIPMKAEFKICLNNWNDKTNL
jgi:DNA polymerase-1